MPQEPPAADATLSLLMARARLRGAAAATDAVAFVSPCPACGHDCAWTEERDDTRLVVAIDCPCAA